MQTAIAEGMSTKTFSYHRVQPVYAEVCFDPPQFPKPVYTAAELRGVRYERAAQEELTRRYGSQYLPNLWFKYQLADGRDRYCQIDGLLIDLTAGRLTIVECKIMHCRRAYDQLVNLYEPVVETAFNKYWDDSTSCRWKIALCEVVKWFDCSVSFPVQPKLRSQVDLARPGEFAIHIYNPKHHFKY